MTNTTHVDYSILSTLKSETCYFNPVHDFPSALILPEIYIALVCISLNLL